MVLKIFLTFRLLAMSTGLRVLFNTNEVTEKSPIGGAKLIGRDVTIKDITLCIRFKLQMLGKFEGKGRLITIESWR